MRKTASVPNFSQVRRALIGGNEASLTLNTEAILVDDQIYYFTLSIKKVVFGNVFVYYAYKNW